MRSARFIGLLSALCAWNLVLIATQSQTPAPAPLSANALDFLVGNWQGTLTYLDQRDNKSRKHDQSHTRRRESRRRVTLPALVRRCERCAEPGRVDGRLGWSGRHGAIWERGLARRFDSTECRAR